MGLTGTTFREVAERLIEKKLPEGSDSRWTLKSDQPRAAGHPCETLRRA